MSKEHYFCIDTTDIPAECFVKCIPNTKMGEYLGELMCLAPGTLGEEVDFDIRAFCTGPGQNIRRYSSSCGLAFKGRQLDDDGNELQADVKMSDTDLLDLNELAVADHHQMPPNPLQNS